MMSRKPSYQWLLIIDPHAQRKFNALSSSEKRAVFRHLRELLLADEPYSLPFVEMLKAKKFARMHKFRAGDYRVFFVLEVVEVTHLKHTYKGTLFLFDIRDRKDAY